MFEVLNRAALMRIFPGSGSVFDGVVTDDALVKRLADDARRWLQAHEATIPAALRTAAHSAEPERDIAVIAAVAGQAASRDGWRWWDVIAPPVAA